MKPFVYFWLFLKASLFSTGGLGNLPSLHQDLLARGWATEADFVQAIAVGQVSPGPNGWLGAMLSLLAITLPTLLVLGVVALHNRVERQPRVQAFTRGLGLGVVGLILAVALTLLRSTVTDWRGAMVVVGALVLALSRRVSVIVLLALGAGIGWLMYGPPLAAVLSAR